MRRICLRIQLLTPSNRFGPTLVFGKMKVLKVRGKIENSVWRQRCGFHSERKSQPIIELVGPIIILLNIERVHSRDFLEDPLVIVDMMKILK